MANLQVKNVPDALHQRLRRQARKQGRTLGDLVLEAVKRELERQQWRDQLKQRPSTDLGISAAALLEQERQLRGESLA